MLKDKILSALKVALGKSSSINDRTLSAYVNLIAEKITDESEVDEAIKPYVEVLKEFQGNINSVAAQVAKDKELGQKSAQEEAAKKTEEAKPDGEPEWFKTFREQHEKRLSAIETEKTTSTRRQKLEEITKDSGSIGAKVLKDFGRMTFESDEAFEEYIEETKIDIETAKQQESEKGLSQSTRPGGGRGNPSKEATEKECDEIAKRLIR